MGRRLMVALAMGGLVINGGCGGSGSSTSPTPVATPTPAPVTTTITSGAGTIPPLATGPVTDFALATPGTVTATLRWTFASSDIDIWVLNGTACGTADSSGVPSGAGCAILCQDIGTIGTSATCSFAGAAGNYRLWATNYGSQNESGTYSVTVTR